jgi:Putative transposase/Transposase zinc-binding domain
MRQIIEQFYSAYRQQYKLSPEQASACQSILQCQTDVLGGYYQTCNHCHYSETQYCSCGNRHCPTCKQQATQDWLDKQQHNSLDVPYYHTVFTLPHEFNGWVRLHPEAMYRLLFQAVWQTLNAFSTNYKRLKGQLGVTCVLHTWGQNLSQHVHLHCLIPGVTLASNQRHIELAKGQYLYPIKALQRKYRGKLVSLIRQAYQAGELQRIKQPQEVTSVLNTVMQKTWVIYIKPYLTQPDTILQYLSRYTYKIAISNQRLVSVDKQTVRFRYTDYRHDNESKIMSLNGVEFLRRFLQHVLPKGFMRIRHYGFLANSVRKKRLLRLRELLKATKDINIRCQAVKINPARMIEFTCPRCHSGQMHTVYRFTGIKKVKRR